MRPLEIALSLINVLILFILTIPGLRTRHWMVNVTLFALPFAGIQILVEGPRWQMVPAYALSVFFALVWLLLNLEPGTRFIQRIVSHPLEIGLFFVLAIFGLTVSVALPLIFPVFHFPKPTGPYAIGTLTYHWIDTSRPELFTADPNDHRELMVQVWYPAQSEPSMPRAPYLSDPEIFAPVARLMHLPSFVFEHLKYVTTNAVPSAPMADDESSYPVLIFLSGRLGYRQSNTFQVEELVSHGYIVAAIDQPYAAAGVVFPDRHLVTMDPRMYDPAHPGHPAFYNTAIPFLAQDVSFTLDQLAALDRSDPNDILKGRLDMTRVGIFGVSLGGIETGEACLREPRLRACLVMDAFMPADVVRSGLHQPTMWISRDAKTMQREGWAQADIDETQTTMRAVYQSIPVGGYLVRVPGMFHLNFTDAPYFSPLAPLLGLSGPFDAKRGFAIINAYSIAFFNQELKNQPSVLLNGSSKQYPEVLFKKR